MVRLALLIGVSEYGPGLAVLPAAVKDVEAMQKVLECPDIGGFQTAVLLNPERQVMEEAIFELFANRQKDDLLLLFYSGHGIKNDSNNLYLAARNTRKFQEALVQPTAVAASYIQSTMNDSKSRRQVVVLDCCFSGAFAEAMTAKDDGSVPLKQQLGGEGRAILTSSTSTQYSFEHPGFDLSIYTHFLVEGIETGIADRNKDGEISVDEIHEYVREKVQEAAPGRMKPELYPIKEGFKIILAKAPVDDPKLKYRREVERYANDGEISSTGRKILNSFQKDLNLHPVEAYEIELQILQPYLDYKEKVQQHKQAYSEALVREPLLSSQTHDELRAYQKVLGLKDEDVSYLEVRSPYKEITSPVKASDYSIKPVTIGIISLSVALFIFISNPATFNWLITISVLISLVGIISAIALPSFLNQANKAKQSEAKQYIGSINRAQQAFFLENSYFTSNLEELGLGIRRETENYKYEISLVDETQALTAALAKTKQLKSYSGAVFLVKSNDGYETTITKICETDQPSNIIEGMPRLDGNNILCPSGMHDPLKQD